MKKFIFSAFAMIAFVGSSMANTISEKKEILFKSYESEINGDPSSCGFAASVMVEEAENQYHIETEKCFDSYVFNLLYTIYYYDCLE